MVLNDVLQKVNAQVLKEHPNAFFYEADCVMIQTDDGTIGPEVDPENTKLVWGTDDGKTIVVTFSNTGYETIEVVNEPWLEDRPMVVYIPMSLDDAVKQLGTANFITETPNVTLRFALHPDITEPQYIFTLERNLYASVGVYSGKVSVTKN